MASLIVNHVYSHLVSESEEELEIARLVTSWMDPGAWYSEAYQRFLLNAKCVDLEAAKLLSEIHGEGVSREDLSKSEVCQLLEAAEQKVRQSGVVKGWKWNGRHELLSEKQLRFPAGLFPLVWESLLKAGFSCKIEDHREFPSSGNEVVELSGVTLRDYQREAVASCLRERRGVIKAIPGAGKTELMISLVASLGVYPVLWLTHTRELLNQTRDRFCSRLRDTGIKVGSIGDGVWQPEDITIATIQTLSSKPRKNDTRNLLRGVKVVISDETHRAPGQTWYKILMGCTAPFRFGVSATPMDRRDGTDLCLLASTGPIIYELTAQQGAALGLFEMPKIRFVSYPITESLPQYPESLSPDWDVIYRDHITKNTDRNNAVVQLCKVSVEAERRVLLLVRVIKHGEMFLERLKEWFAGGDHVSFAHGSILGVARDEMIARFRKGICRVLIATSIFDEGVDIPEIDTIIIAAGGDSAIKAVQRVGRGMRKSAGGKGLIVYDFVDDTNSIVLRHSKARRKMYSTLGEVRDFELTRGEHSD